MTQMLLAVVKNVVTRLFLPWVSCKNFGYAALTSAMFLLCLGVIDAKAETYTLQSGKTLTGKVLQQNDGEIKLETKNGVINVPRRMITVTGINIPTAASPMDKSQDKESNSNTILPKDGMGMMMVMCFLNASMPEGAVSSKEDRGGKGILKGIHYFDKEGRLLQDRYLDENNDCVMKEYNKQGEVISESHMTEESVRTGRAFGHPDAGERKQERFEIEKREDDPAALRIVEETKKAYAELQSYSADVKVISDQVIDAAPFKKTIKGRLQLLKPNFYNVGWGVDSSAYPDAAWNSGGGDFIYFVKHYQKEKSALRNFYAAAGISSSISYTVPTLFFSKDENIFSQLQNFRLRDPEVIDDEDCHVVEAVGNLTPKIIFWISKERKIILQVEEHRDTRFGKDPYADLDRLSDEEIKKMMIAYGEEQPTRERIKKWKESNARTAKEMANLDVKGTTKEIFENIQINPKIEPASLEFSVPSNAVLEK